MHTHLTRIAMLSASISITSHAADPPFAQARSLAFLLERGGIRIDQPVRKNNQWYLPVICNVSGIKAISRPPQVIHSGLAWSESIARVGESEIDVSVITAMQGSRAPSALCGPASLQRITSGSYQVFYLDPDGTRHPLGAVDVRR